MGTKLIEVALPLDEINKAAAHEKMPGIGPHPRGLHLWWARRPLAAARAVLFSSIVDDPSSDEYRWPDGQTRARSEAEVLAERERLHNLIVELVQWENSNNEQVLGKARAEIMRATDGNPPPVLDPFAGGGSIPLEAQRLGLEAHASDLNPVAVLINKALIEIPPKFAGQPPVNPADRKRGMGAKWKGAAGLAADVRYYGQWMRDEAERRIGHLYPKVQLPPEQGGGEATVIAWLWARTVKCPNPACGAQTPLVSSFWLSKKLGKETYVDPLINETDSTVDFKVIKGKSGPRQESVTRRGAVCLFCDSPMPFSFLRAEGKAHRMGHQLMAIVAEGPSGRAYVGPNNFQAEVAKNQGPSWEPDGTISHWPGRTNVVEYGMTEFKDLFTPRQLVALTTFSDLVGEARERVRTDALAAGMPDDGIGIADGGTGANAYADSAATYLAFAVDRAADFNSSITRWVPTNEKVMNSFARQAIPMVWDFTEANILEEVVGGWPSIFDYVCKCILTLSATSGKVGVVEQQDASRLQTKTSALVSTDPPYYDNIGYADLSDYFYTWLRKSLRPTYPDLLKTLLVPKQEELVATPYRFKGGRDEADRFFEDGLQQSFVQMRSIENPAFPLTVYYAFKQSESDGAKIGKELVASTGWETMLEGLVQSKLVVTATWPFRSEQSERIISQGTNALASSIVLACRVRPDSASTTTRNDFLRELRRELPRKLKTMQQASIAPVDLAQAAIGPGMAIYSRYSAVLEPSGERLRVRTALQLINQVLDETLTEQDSAHDRETGWAVAWFEQNGMSEADYGQAETLATAKAVSVAAMERAGIIRSGRGRVQLLKRSELPEDWSPERDRHLVDWEVVQYLIRALETGGQGAAAALKRQLGSRAELAKDLAYRLYTIAERKGWAQEALAYNGLVVNWPEITSQAGALPEMERQIGF